MTSGKKLHSGCPLERLIIGVTEKGNMRDFFPSLTFINQT